jgi:hypothetical protein
MGIGMRHQLVGLLAGAVEAHGVIDIVAGTERHEGIGAIDRRGRGIDQVPAAVVPAALEHVEEADEIRLDIGMRIGQRMPHPGLRRQIHDLRKAMRCEQFRRGLAFGDVHLLEPEAGKRAELRDASFLEPRIIIGIEIVDPDHVVAVRQQAAGNMHADESGRTGDENRPCHDHPFQGSSRRDLHSDHRALCSIKQKCQ